MGRNIYLTLLFIGIGIFCLQKLQIALPEVINNYVNDLFCLPIVLGIISFVIKRWKNDQNFKFPLVFVLILALYYSIFFEYYLPKSNQRYTSDWIDVGLYFSGALLFYWFERFCNLEKGKEIKRPNF